jgi:hypothetical protein
MDSEEFVRGVKAVCSDTLAEGEIGALRNLPGRRPSQRLLRQSTWFHQLGTEDQVMLAEIMKMLRRGPFGDPRVGRAFEKCVVQDAILKGVSKQFTYEFDETSPNTIHFDYSPEADERLRTAFECGSPSLYLNRSGLLTLAKILIKMSMGPYTNGFHVHLHEDLNADHPECLTIMLNEDADPSQE